MYYESLEKKLKKMWMEILLEQKKLGTTKIWKI